MNLGLNNMLKLSVLLLGTALAWGAQAQAQAQTQALTASGRIFRCGNEYTNNPQEAQSRDCRPVDVGNVTVIEAPKAPAAPAAASASRSAPAGTSVTASASPATRVDAADQRARDTEARAILETELRRAELRLAELLKEFNNGEPEKIGPEFRNHQKYLDRVADLRAAITRTESDIAGIRREIARLPARP